MKERVLRVSEESLVSGKGLSWFGTLTIGRLSQVG